MSTISERRKFILDHIAKDGFVKVSKLAESLGVTQATIRKDLNYLEMQGVLQRAHGSAHTQSQHAIDLSLNTKRLINFEAKQKIAEKAVSLIKNDESILVASGSTITVFAENLKPKGRLNVVSISVNISAHLGDIPGITVMQVGGILYGNTLSVLGAEASKTIENLYCIGRNGQHRYNNMDHSMLTAMEAVDNIKNGIKTKHNIWNVNTEEEYHETK